MRIIPRLDVKGKNLIKGVHLEGLRVLGSPIDFATLYYQSGADELLLMDCVASLYGRNNLYDLIKIITENIFVPITLGGGIRCRRDVILALRSGVDKFAINSAVMQNIGIISEMAEFVGSQSIVLSVEAKKVADGRWEAYFNNGREKSGREVLEWVEICQEMGVGEILLTSVDQEGTRRGFDLDLLNYLGPKVSVPLIVSGGIGSIDDVLAVATTRHASAIAIADLFHYRRHTIDELKSALFHKGFNTRRGNA